jgi:hypothetical protein
MPLTEEEISQIAIRTAEEVMKRRGDICNCVDWFLVATTAAEALEHNATVSDMAKDLHEELKEIIPQKQLEDLEFKHVLLQGYITEGMAEMVLAGSLGSIRGKCNVDISDVKKLADSGFEAIKKRDPIMAAQNFSKLKGELVRLADNICGQKEGNPGAKEPWQMTRAEISRIETDFREKEKPLLDELNRLRKEPMSLEREQAIDKVTAQLDKIQEPTAKIRLSDHKYLVEIALSEGKLVPPEVLADYPDLRKESNLGAKEESNPVRVRFDRADIDSAIAAAKRLESEKDLYIFATHLGYTIDRRPPPGMQSYVLVHPDGTTETIKPGG